MAYAAGPSTLPARVPELSGSAHRSSGRSCVVLAAGLGLLTVLGGCGSERGGSSVSSLERAGKAPEGRQVEVDEFVDGFVVRFQELFRQAVLEAVPRSRATAEALAALGDELVERPVLESYYIADSGRYRLVDQDQGIQPAGDEVAQRLAAAADHALKPEDYHVPQLQAARQAWADATRTASSLPAAPPAPQGDELDALKQLAEAMESSLSLPEAESSFLSRLVSESSPVPRLAQAFEQARAARAAVQSTAARWELLLADGLLHYARDMSRDNTKAAERTARREYARLVKEAERAAQEREQQAQELAAEQPQEEPASPEERDEALSEDGDEAQAEPQGPEKPLVLRDREAFVQQRLLADLQSVEDQASAASLLDGLVPRFPQYRKLQQALVRYRKYVEQGGWEVVPPDERLRPGRRKAVVRKLKERLAKEDYYDGPLDDQFDRALRRAIIHYQEAHQISVTGKPHSSFWRSLNIPAERRLAGIELTLQRWRESSIGDDEYYVHINIPDFHLELWRKGKRLARHKVIVGENKDKRCDEDTETEVLAHATPIQSAMLELLVFSPYWNVTRTIKEQELDPERGKDPLYYEKNGYEVMRAGKPGEWVREMPGPANSLGFVKFIFPNPHATFVHDTPTKQLFDHPVRSYSHGCMRLHEPRKLAQLVLEIDGQWDQRRFDRLYEQWSRMDFTPLKEEEYDPELYETLRRKASEMETFINLRRSVPVHVEYYTVRVADNGDVQFLADIYDYDEKRLYPTEAKACVPESKEAQKEFRRMARKVHRLQKKAVKLAPRVVLALEAAKTIDPQESWRNRHLLKELQSLENFNVHHENLAQMVLEEHEKLSGWLRRYRWNWNKRLTKRAVKISRLLDGLTRMTNRARYLCRLVEKKVGPLEQFAPPPPPAPEPPVAPEGTVFGLPGMQTSPAVSPLPGGAPTTVPGPLAPDAARSVADSPTTPDQ